MSLVFESAAVPDDLVRRIAERFSPDKIILFGSLTRGDAGPESDIDLLVLFPEVADPHKRAAELYAALLDFPRPTDIEVSTTSRFERYRNVVNTVYWPAWREGKVLYERTHRREPQLNDAKRALALASKVRAAVRELIPPSEPSVYSGSAKSAAPRGLRATPHPCGRHQPLRHWRRWRHYRAGRVRTRRPAARTRLLHGKIVVGPAAKGAVDLDAPVKQNLKAIARRLQRGVDDWPLGKNLVFAAYQHEVTIQTLGIEFRAVVFFAQDSTFNRNLLGCSGWLDRLRIAIVDYDRLLFVIPTQS